MKIDSLLFDLDGTLWDSVDGICAAWSEVIAKQNLSRTDIKRNELTDYMGLFLLDIGKKMFPELEEDTVATLMEACCRREEEYLALHGGELYPLLEETLASLSKKYKLAIVSNCQDGYIQCFFAAHPLATYFTDTECAGVTGLAKGDNIKLVMERNGLKNTLFIGDTQGDADAAQKAGVPFVFASYGFGNPDSYAYKIETFADLLQLVKELEAEKL